MAAESGSQNPVLGVNPTSHPKFGRAKKGHDRTSVAGKVPAATRHVSLVVVGAGRAGLAATLEAARLGVETMLIDEHPIARGLMGMDVPLHFGQRMNSAVSNKSRMVELLVESNPEVSEAFELGVDVQVGVYVVGAFVSGPTLQSLSKPLLVLADEERSWVISFDHLIVASGARDLGMCFAGWEKPGVMGSQAAMILMQRYRAFDGRSLLIMGSGSSGLQVALAAIDQGLHIAGIVEVDEKVRGAEEQEAALAAHGVPFFTRHAIKEAFGKTEVEGVRLVRLDAKDKPVAGSETSVSCDTVVTAIGAVPNIELLDVLGCQSAFCSERGGYVPIVKASGLTSTPGVYAVGDCTGVFEGKLTDVRIATNEGRRAGIAVATALGLAPADSADPVSTQPTSDGSVDRQHDHWRRWLGAEIAACGWDINICQCEEVTCRELVGVQPPRYLNWGSSQMAARNLETLATDGTVNQDQIKRLTRAGMGPCQGRRCREQVQMLLAMTARVEVGDIALPSYRPPVRPLPLRVLSPEDEPQEVRENWVGWFNIPTIYTSPHEQKETDWKTVTSGTVAGLSGEKKARG